MPFQKGNRVNPGGRPQRKDWADMLRIVGNEKGPDGKRKLRLLAEKVYDLALAGDMEATKEIGNRRDGRPKAEAEVNVTHGWSGAFLDALRKANDARAITDQGGEIIDLTPLPPEPVK
jgi:hypothetical protein